MVLFGIVIPPSYTPIPLLTVVDQTSKTLSALAEHLASHQGLEIFDSPGLDGDRESLQEFHNFMQDQANPDRLKTALAEVDDSQALSDSNTPNEFTTSKAPLINQLRGFLGNQSVESALEEGWVDQQVNSYREGLVQFVDLLKQAKGFFAQLVN